MYCNRGGTSISSRVGRCVFFGYDTRLSLMASVWTTCSGFRLLRYCFFWTTIGSNRAGQSADVGRSIKERLWRIRGLDIGGPTDRSILMWCFYLDQVGSDRAGRSRGARQPQRNVLATKTCRYRQTGQPHHFHVVLLHICQWTRAGSDRAARSSDAGHTNKRRWWEIESCRYTHGESAVVDRVRYATLKSEWVTAN